MKLGAHRYFDFKKLSIDPTFQIKGDAPVRLHSVGEKLKVLYFLIMTICKKFLYLNFNVP